MPDKNDQPIFGQPEEWEGFRNRHALFLERLPHLYDALDTAFVRTVTGLESIDKFILTYGALCCADFDEVLLCCENGYGAAGMRLLRSLYERAVTLHYLHLHPDQFDDFWDYQYVAERKLIVQAEEAFGKGIFDEANVAEVEQRYQEVKERFMVTDCRKCKTKRPNYTWNKLPFPVMAQQAGDLGMLIVPAYYVPLRSAHATVASLLDRVESDEDVDIMLNPRVNQRSMADNALLAAHNVILDVLDVQEQRFKVPGLGEKIQVCFQDFIDISKSEARRTG